MQNKGRRGRPRCHCVTRLVSGRATQGGPHVTLRPAAGPRLRATLGRRRDPRGASCLRDNLRQGVATTVDADGGSPAPACLGQGTSRAASVVLRHAGRRPAQARGGDQRDVRGGTGGDLLRARGRGNRVLRGGSGRGTHVVSAVGKCVQSVHLLAVPAVSSTYNRQQFTRRHTRIHKNTTATAKTHTRTTLHTGQ